MRTPTAERVRKRRQALREAGLRPLQIWVPDTSKPGFGAECRRQAQAVSRVDLADPDLGTFMDAAWADLHRISE